MKYENIEDFKYRIIKTFSIATPLRPLATVKGEFATLCTNGRLYIKKGFLWDGASGAIDTDNVMLPSCVHDVGCSWYLKKLIDIDMRHEFDDLFKTLLKKQGMNTIRVAAMYAAVRANTSIRYGS